MAERQLVLFHNATIHTLDERRPRAEWFLVLGDRFQRVGEGPPPLVQRTVDLGGKVVVPGFVDSHAHFFQTGIDALQIDLTGTASLSEVDDRLKAGAPAGVRTWVFAHGFEEDTLAEDREMTRHDLDAMFKDRAVWVNRVDYHSAVVNSAALRRLEIPAGTPGLVTDSGGQPNGILRAEAYFHAKARVARLYSIEMKEKAVKAAAAACTPHGVTAVHALEGGRVFGDEGVQVVLKKASSVPLDVTLFLQEKNVYLSDRMGFRHLGGCILIDGSIGSYTAALDVPYEGHPNLKGHLYEHARELNGFVEEAHVAGCQLSFHAIGPRAIELVLDAYERALDRHPRYDHRHRIEHFELATDLQIKRAADLGVVVGMQPAFEHYWGGPNGMYASRLGDRWHQSNRLAEILDAGIIIAGGSDTNVTPPDPLLGMHAAVNHPNPDQRVSAAQALRMMTLDAAYAGFNEGRHGSISAGKDASFAVLGDDPLKVPRDRIKDVAVLETWYRGRRVHGDGGHGRA